MAGKATAVDLGSRTLKVLVVKDGKSGLAVQRFAALEVPDQPLSATDIPLQHAVLGLAGKDMILRYSQVPPSPDWQLKNLMDLEIQDLSAQSGGELSADYNVLPIVDEEGGMETVLMALARNDALQRASAQVTEAGGSVAGHVPNCVALYNAYLRCGRIEEDAVVCLCNLGHETIDIALVRGVDLLFARNLSGGGKVFDDAIAGAFNVSGRKAEQLKKDLLDLDPASRGRYASGQAEKVTIAAGGASAMIVSAIQSSLSFCQTQTRQKDLRLQRILLTGGGAKLRGLEGLLREALRCTVEVFDPFQNCDLSALPPAEAQQLDVYRHEAVVALGLAAGKLDDTLYSLEILPESVKRKKRFFERTIYDLAAGVIAAAVLALLTVDAQGRLDQVSGEARKIAQKKNTLTQIDAEAKQLFEQNEDKREIVAALAEKAVPLDGTVRTLRAIQQALPAELWLQKLEVVRESAGRAGARPLVQLEGFGKDIGQGDVAAAYQNFRRKLAQLVPLSESDAKATPITDGKTQFSIKIDFQRSATGAEKN